MDPLTPDERQAVASAILNIVGKRGFVLLVPTPHDDETVYINTITSIDDAKVLVNVIAHAALQAASNPIHRLDLDQGDVSQN